MKKYIVIGSLALAGALLLAGCGGDSHHAVMSMPSTQSLSTAQVLEMARTTSESTDPVSVNGSAVVVAGADDQSSDPLAVS